MEEKRDIRKAIADTVNDTEVVERDWKGIFGYYKEDEKTK